MAVESQSWITVAVPAISALGALIAALAAFRSAKAAENAVALAERSGRAQVTRDLIAAAQEVQVEYLRVLEFAQN